MGNIQEERTSSPKQTLKRKYRGSEFDDPMKRLTRKLSLIPSRKELPIASARDKLLQEVRDNSVLIVVGETGSGKTTQLPQYLHEDGYCSKGVIAVTQPRRVAATAVAGRVAEEMGVQLGEEVGYSIRFEDETSPNTDIKFLTDGMLLREALLDPLLRRYSVVVLDEAHERTLHTDVLIGLLKGIHKSRQEDLRIIIMSATLDFGKFQAFFQGAKAVYIQGRQYPVQVIDPLQGRQYPTQLMYTSESMEDYIDAVLRTTFQIHLEEEAGDILVFLTGQEEILDMERLICERVKNLPKEVDDLIPVPLYSAMPTELQAKAFEPAPKGARKVVLATNVAETSLTITGLRYVVDTGLAKARGYNARTGIESLLISEISKAQARQRLGRAGREGPGKCFRLYTELKYEELKSAPVPEIQRCRLATVVLQLKALGIDNILNFDFLDPPPQAALIKSLEMLYALGALDDEGKLTKDIGLRLARLPLDPQGGRVVLSAAAAGCTQEAVMALSVLGSDPLFYTPREKQAEAAAAHARFTSSDGDHVSLVKVLREYLGKSLVRLARPNQNFVLGEGAPIISPCSCSPGPGA
ncbi:hypothetical protein CYMTET_53420 [Cymbomonas tetramitiformis]|uniref:RNA helicase n=1 Tax=Cymbomonas tetramitiformis TaxID=36881 RepID=A0AAE0EQL9_9CHLO|nr:hypothetical protein CYMTET_53420 [Cymbomonas tetramitiformis]